MNPGATTARPPTAPGPRGARQDRGRRPRLLAASAAVAAGMGAHTIGYADQDEVPAMARDAVPGLLAPFLEIDARVARGRWLAMAVKPWGAAPL